MPGAPGNVLGDGNKLDVRRPFGGSAPKGGGTAATECAQKGEENEVFFHDLDCTN